MNDTIMTLSTSLYCNDYNIDPESVSLFYSEPTDIKHIIDAININASFLSSCLSSLNSLNSEFTNLKQQFNALNINMSNNINTALLNNKITVESNFYKDLNIKVTDLQNQLRSKINQSSAFLTGYTDIKCNVLKNYIDNTSTYLYAYLSSYTDIQCNKLKNLINTLSSELNKFKTNINSYLYKDPINAELNNNNQIIYDSSKSDKFYSIISNQQTADINLLPDINLSVGQKLLAKITLPNDINVFYNNFKVINKAGSYYITFYKMYDTIDMLGYPIKVINQSLTEAEIIFDNPLCFTITDDSTIIQLNKYGNPDSIQMYYKINDGKFLKYEIGQYIELNYTDKLYFGNLKQYFSKDISNYYYFIITRGSATVSQNCNSLLNNTDVKSYSFYRLFRGPIFSTIENHYLISVKDLILPSKTLAVGCYYGMFEDCTNLTTPPELPATTLADSCYRDMFKGCTSLTIAPTLSVANLINSCYRGMFADCTSLTTAPNLPAIILADHCYDNMFYGCTNLNLISTNFINWLEQLNATDDWVSNVSANGTFYKKSALLSSIGECYIPEGWNIINTDAQPQSEQESESQSESITFDNSLCFTALQNTTITLSKSGSPYDVQLYTKKNNEDYQSYTLNNNISLSKNDKLYFINKTQNLSKDSNNCYKFIINGKVDVAGDCNSLLNGTDVKVYSFISLFRGCVAINNASGLILSSMTAKYGCYDYMFSHCTSLTTAPDLPATNLVNNCYNNMFSHCTSLTTAPDLPATTLADYCYYCMFYGCTSLTTAPVLPATTLAEHCYQSMFSECTSLTTAPGLLPASTLADYCYYCMFYGCTSLITASNLPASILVDWCYDSMFYNCVSLTIAPELPATILARQCYQNMFHGCTSLTTAPNLPASTLVNGCYQRMFYGCSNLNLISANFTDWAETDYWVCNVSANGTFYKKSVLPAVFGTSLIPEGWNVINID